jgi:hypothetical protein
MTAPARDYKKHRFAQIVQNSQGAQRWRQVSQVSAGALISCFGGDTAAEKADQSANGDVTTDTRDEESGVITIATRTAAGGYTREGNCSS